MFLDGLYRHPDQMAHAAHKDLLPPSQEGSQACPDSLQNVERPARVCILQAAGKFVFFLYCIFFFSISFIIFALPLPLLPSRNSDPGSHKVGSSLLPPPHYGSCLGWHFYPEKTSALSCLVDPH